MRFSSEYPFNTTIMFSAAFVEHIRQEQQTLKQGSTGFFGVAHETIRDPQPVRVGVRCHLHYNKL